MNLNVDDIYATSLGKQHFANGEDKTLTISGGEVRTFQQDNGQTKRRLVLFFAEIPQPWVVNKTNAASLATHFGTGEATAWKGQQVTLYVNPDVEYAGRVVGGVRVRLQQQPQQERPAADGAVRF